MNAHDGDAHDTFTGTTGIEISVPVPLPTEVPQPPNLSQLPAHVLHSGTVETLIGQNEDLMARLKVNIRRNSMLEQRILQQDETLHEITNLNNSLVAQLQIMQEKDRLLREKSRDFDSRIDYYEDEIQLLKTKLEATEDRNHELQAGIAFEKAYRRRVRAWVRPYLDTIRKEKAALEFTLAAREADINDIRSRFTDTISHMQSAQRVHSSEKTQLVEQYEDGLRTIDAEITRLRSEVKILRDRSQRLDEAVVAKAEIENRNIMLERKIREVEASLGGELKTFQEQTASFRKEAKSLAAELNESRSELARLQREREVLRNELARAQDQLETMQAVWAETQKKIETSAIQQDALNRLNQELSRQLKDQRKSSEKAVTVTSGTHEKLDRIDGLLAEIEAGFASGRGMEILEDEAAGGRDSQSRAPQP